MPRSINPEARAAKRRAILEAAGRLFAERGFHQTGMAAICEAVGMSPGGLYRYFPSKAALIEGIVELEREDALGYLDAVEAADGLVAGLVDLLIRCAQEAADPEGVALSLDVAAEAVRNPAVGEHVAAVEQEFIERLAGLVRAGQSLGEVSPSVDPLGVALVLTATAHGLTVTSAEDVETLRPALTSAVRGLLGKTVP